MSMSLGSVHLKAAELRQIPITNSKAGTVRTSNKKKPRQQKLKSRSGKKHIKAKKQPKRDIFE